MSAEYGGSIDSSGPMRERRSGRGDALRAQPEYKLRVSAAETQNLRSLSRNTDFSLKLLFSRSLTRDRHRDRVWIYRLTGLLLRN
ncbi:hypothetical protein F2P81_005111 [Scophthalmus maximus]|uniref:Uncharacterized protein n=1 Tax=Scophthalmus maximus TaxID=52904 RepID=A0A6A4T9S8_SCOMX|nr:hypothetical protein F2P81_005111 [Scophthalmus maximus]